MKTIIKTSNAPAAIGPYSQAVRTGNFLYLSGQIPINPATGNIEATDITGQTIQCFNNIKAVLKEAGFGMEHIVKTTVFLADMALFAEMNKIYEGQFEGNYPARSAVAVRELPKSALVEIEVIACIG